MANLLPLERLEKIKAILRDRKKVDVLSLTEILGVSQVTVRKYLDHLHEEGFLKRTFGGAILTEQEPDQIETSYLHITNYHAKERVCDLALQRIRPGDAIFLGSGSTCYVLAKKLAQIPDLTIITTNITAIKELIPRFSKVFLIGGEIILLDGLTSTSTEKVGEYLKGIYVNEAFTGVKGIDFKAGLTVNHQLSSYVYREIRNIAKSWTLLTDSSKFNRIAMYNVAPLDAVNCVISDAIDEEYRAYCEQRGIEVVSAE